jgi:hypothetical protein
MREYRITFRVHKNGIKRIEMFIKKNYPKVKNRSQVVRLALDEFFQNDKRTQE